MSATAIFLSYASVDRARVEVLVKALEGEGLNVWWDRDIPRGQNFNRVIENALEQARCAIVLWSSASVDSEWVVNEASEARKRGMLVPVLIDDVDPPLEFRHLQAARLIEWRGDKSDSEWAGLLAAVRGLVGQGGSAQMDRNRARGPAQDGRRWWQTLAGMAMGAGALLVGVAILVIALKQVGLIGGGAISPAATRSVVAPPAVVEPPAATQGSVAPNAAASHAAAQSASGRANATTNLLDPEQGGKLVIASEDNWKDVMQKEPRTTVIGSHGFAVFALRDDKPATIDGIAVYVESTNSRNLKELSIYAADQSETGPFRKITTVTLPNYRNMRAPLHELKFEPFTARYVKLEIVSWQEAGVPNGYVGNMQLLGRVR